MRTSLSARNHSYAGMFYHIFGGFSTLILCPVFGVYYKHSYTLNGGLLWCEKCGSEMEGRSGTGRSRARYYYYVCKNTDCKSRVPADDIEKVILERIKELSTRKDIMSDIIRSTNEKLQKELPELRKQKVLLQSELTEIKNFADGIMSKWLSLASEDSTLFLKDKLDELGKRRREIESGIEALEEMIEEIERESVSRELVMLALSKFTDVFDQLQPYRQKELLRLVLHKAILAPDNMKIALYGRPPEIGLFSTSESDRFAQTSTWLPGARACPNVFTLMKLIKLVNLHHGKKQIINR